MRPDGQHGGTDFSLNGLPRWFTASTSELIVPRNRLGFLALRGRSMAESARRGGKLNVFISYSRNDLAFADQLRVALQGFGFGVTIDRDDITGGDAWKKRLSDLIRDADTVVFVLSPSSANSPTCAWEVKQALDDGKRILPVLCRALDGANPRLNLPPSTTYTSTRSRHFPARGSARGLSNSRRPSTPIRTGCASTRATCD